MILTHTFPQSSVLASCSYDTETKQLTITFLNGGTYIYVEVSPNTYGELIDAKSPGKYFAMIKKQLVLKK